MVLLETENAAERRNGMVKKGGLKPGTPTPKSGQYEVNDPKGKPTGKEITSTEKNPLPPTSKPGETYTLVDPTKHKNGK